MGLVPIRGFEIQDASARVRSVLPEWKPARLKTRKGYRDGLKAFLQKKLEGYPFSSEREVAGVISDITLSDEVLIEIQKDLKTKKDYDALVKRLDAFKDWGAVILVIVAGTVAPAFMRKLDDHVNFLNNDLEWTDHKDIVIIRK